MQHVYYTWKFSLHTSLQKSQNSMSEFLHFFIITTGGRPSNTLREIHYRVMSNSDCLKTFTVEDYKLCAKGNKQNFCSVSIYILCIKLLLSKNLI